ncbi:MAG: type II toxin-antitoxin system PemK/MazF family toxin [Coxiellaceae bacterium]|nr:type II toxin-antitoxin system PemK/MazF family toxin [Coxiellaceae bacterium]
MGKILRGDIVWANLDVTQGHEQSGRRPVLILSHVIFNEKSGTVIAVALTSQQQKAGFPLTLLIAQKILKKTVTIKISQIRTLSVLRLGKKIGHLHPAEVDRVVEGLSKIIR